MAVKTFTDNTSLPASDINTYLNNGGLVYVTSQTVGSAVATVTVSNAFSATYDNYRIVVNNVQGSTAGDFRIQFGSTTSGYYGSYYYDGYGGASGVVRSNNGAFAWFAPISSTALGGEQMATMDIGSPFLSVRTTITGQGYGNGYFTWTGSQVANTTSYTSFMLYPGSGTLTGGTITVYGYRKA